MKNYLNRFICCVALLTGVVSLPFFGYAQQDEPKRVAVVVVAKEISPTKEFVQLPATNLPIVVGHISKPKTYRARTVVSAAVKKPAVSRPIVKEAVVTKTKSAPIATTKPTVKLAPAKVEVVKKPTSVAVVSKKSTPVVVSKVTKEAVVAKAKPAPLVTVKPVVKSAPTPKVEMVKKATAPVVAKTNPPVVASNKVEQVIVTKKDVVVLPPAVVAENNPSVKTTNTLTTVPQASVTKDDKKVIDEFSNEVTVANDLEVSQVSHSAKVNALNYIWIGFFLMLAGFVLGLLFGKPAFLVSVAGVVFIVLGFMV